MTESSLVPSQTLNVTETSVCFAVTMTSRCVTCFSHEKRPETTESGEGGPAASDEAAVHHAGGQRVGVTGLYPQLRAAGSGE